ncbi:MAG: class I SAM-dependent methyltransferase [Candidatus Daviesbacteria bacterium]|nr:MAG: class I SAM-dependent methyltransferase [Candidatus Daviesbacteria bacterium]
MKKITYQWIFKHLGKGRGEKLLDIGTGYGFALLEAKRKGYQPVGIEPSPELSKIASKAHGVKVINDFFENVKFPIESFHLVSMFDSIEHMLNPQASLKKAAALVKPGGFLVITTPDINSLSAKLFYKYWFHLKNEHYYYFNKEILKNLLLKNGFTVKISMGQKRPLTLKYIENHFRIYPIPFLSITFRHLLSLVPTKIKNKIFTIYDGNLFMVAQKSVKIA